jgi:hypothetical protein
MYFHLPAKFIKLSENKLLQKLSNIILKKTLKIKIILYKYLFRWYKNILLIKKSSLAYMNNKNTFRQRKNINLNIDDGGNNKNGNIDRYINEYFLLNNMRRDDKNTKKDKNKNKYFTISNEKRNRTYNNPKNKDIQYKLEKNLNLNNYEESILTDKNLNKMIEKNIKKKEIIKK